MICRECKKEIKDGSKFCKHCGRNVENDSEISFCTSCGKQIKNNSLFCKHCGASVGSVESVSKEDNKNNLKTFSNKAIIIVLVLVIGLLAMPHSKGKLDKQSDVSTYKSNPGKISIPKVENDKYSPNDNDCFICGGDGKKDCTSCVGGQITEYESGMYMGYGSPTREVKKRCTLCNGSGEVKCYH